MGALDNIITLTITRNTTSPTQTGFGTPMLVGYHTEYLDRVRTYTSLTGLTDDGFATSHPIYRMAQDLLAQTNSPPQFKVGRRALAPTQTIDYTPITTTEGFVHTITIASPDGTAVATASYTNGAAQTVAGICTGLTAAINGTAAAVTATDNTTKVTIAADNAGDLFGYSAYPKEADATFKDVTADPGIATDLAAIALADNDWYAMAVDSNSEAEINAAAAWVESNAKIFACQSQDSDILASGTTTDVASDLETSAYDRTAIFFHRDNFDFIACAWLGKLLPEQPGSVTWAFKRLASIAADSLTSSNLTTLDAKTCNHYVQVAGINITRYGYAASGEYLDIMRGSDWLKARIQERIYALLVNSAKIPYTDKGVQAIRAEILAQLGTGVSRGFLAADPAPTCTVPAVADVSSVDKAARTLNDVTFRATLAGAIHKVTIAGQLSV